MSCVIAIASQKGGTAKTTTALNLALALSEQGQRVLLVDADPQGAVGHSLKQGELAHEGLAEVLTQQKKASQVIVTTKNTQLALFCRGRLDPADTCEFELELYAPGRLKDILSEVADGFDIVLIDTPSGLGLPTRAALHAADFVLVPLQAEPLAYRSVGQVLHVIDKVREAENPDLALLGIVMTMLSRKDEVSMGTMVNSWQELSGVFDTIIPRDPVFGRASEQGVPLAYLGGKPSPEAKRFSLLATEVLHRLADLNAQLGADNERPARVLL